MVKLLLPVQIQIAIRGKLTRILYNRDESQHESERKNSFYFFEISGMVFSFFLFLSLFLSYFKIVFLSIILFAKLLA